MRVNSYTNAAYCELRRTLKSFKLQSTLNNSSLRLPVVAGISGPAKKFLSAVGYNAKEFQAL